MDFSIDDELVSAGEALVKFIDREVVDLENKNTDVLYNERKLFDETGRFSPKVVELRKWVRMRSAELGFYTMFGDEELGGSGLGPLANIYIQELINHRYGPERPLIQTYVIPSPFTNGLTPILRWLSPALQPSVLPMIASGEKTLCFGLSEPDAGSDVFSMRSRAVRDGDTWTITGTKQWITNAPYADYAIIFAITNPELANGRKRGITAFLVDTQATGFSVPSVIPIMGHLGAEIGIISLDGVRVTDAYRLGEVDEGLKVALTGISAGRLSMAASCVGLARWALDQAIEYSKIRKTFNKAIAEHQSIQNHLAECASDIYAAKTMVQHCAWLVLQKRPAIKELSMVKSFATEMLSRVMDRCIQVHGAMGLTNELRLEAGYRYARVLRIPDGTGEIQRRTIARQLISGDTSI